MCDEPIGASVYLLKLLYAPFCLVWRPWCRKPLFCVVVVVGSSGGDGVGLVYVLLHLLDFFVYGALCLRLG